MNLIAVPVALALLALALLVAAYVLWPAFRAPRGPQGDTRRTELEEERDTLYAAARTLDAERAAGTLDEEDYHRLRLRDETRAALVLQRLDELPPAPAAPATGAGRRAWPLAAMVALLCVAATAAAYRYAVPPLQGLPLAEEDRVALSAARRLPGLEAQLNAEAVRDGKASSASLHAFADVAWQALDYNKAAQAYITLLARNPHDPLALARYGSILFFAGQADDATTFLKTALQLDPKQSDAALTLGNLYFSKGKPADAIAAWQLYQTWHPGGPTNRVADLIASARTQVSAADPAAKLFAASCAGCHGSDGQGMVGPRLAGDPNLKDAARTESIILNGKGQMPGFAGKLTPAQVKALTGYLNRL